METRNKYGKRNNQSFCHIPHSLLIQMITYKANAVGIQVIVTEESYTSKASFWITTSFQRMEKMTKIQLFQENE